MIIAMIASVASSPVRAQQFDCVLTDPVCGTDCAHSQLRFFIDTGQFAPPQDPNDPPRRQITTVTIDGVVISASAILMQGGIRGFYEDAGTLGHRMMIVQQDNTARLIQQPGDTILTGECARF